MLDRTTTYMTPAAPSTRVITGQTVAKSNWGPRMRADLAAKWKLGLVEVDPTTKLAATVFGVSVPLVNEAIEDLEARGVKAIPPIDSIWSSMSGNERDAFVDRHMLTIWDAIERVTA